MLDEIAPDAGQLKRRARQARYRELHREKIRERDRLHGPKRRKQAHSGYHTTYAYVVSRLITATRTRARNKGWEFDLAPAWIDAQLALNDYCCSMTGILLRVDPQRPSDPFQLSIDRIDNDRGYTRDNCRLTCLMYNLARNQASDEEIVDFARNLLAKQTVNA